MKLRFTARAIGNIVEIAEYIGLRNPAAQILQRYKALQDGHGGSVPPSMTA